MFHPIPGVFVIGFGHRARHGKDRAARALIEAWPRAVQRFSFADDLYAYCRIAYGMTRKDASLLQRVGVEMRGRDEDVWVRSVYTKLLDARLPVAVITDCRFPNECAFVKALGGVTVRVERRMADGSLFRPTDRDPDHISETALADYLWDYTVTNPDGDPDTFVTRVRSLFMALTAEAA